MTLLNVISWRMDRSKIDLPQLRISMLQNLPILAKHRPTQGDFPSDQAGIPIDLKGSTGRATTT